MTIILRRILFIFTGLLGLSVSVYIILELSSINETEKKVQDVYEDQLVSIIFSINQYSQDILNSWVDDLSKELSKSNVDVDSLTFQVDRSSVSGIVVTDSLLNIVSHLSDQETLNFQELLDSNREVIEKLFGYSNSGFKKLEPIMDNRAQSYLFFVNSNDSKQLVAIRIDPSEFISEILAPRLERMTHDRIILSAYSETLDTLIYSTNAELLIGKKLIMTDESNLWLFPSNFIGINFLGQTLQELVKERMRNNLIILGIICLILLAGLSLIIRNVNRQIQLSNMKSDFVSNVSHEIRTPLALINMYAETLEMDRVKDDTQRHQFYKIILGETRRLTGLVNRILKFSKLDAGKQEYNYEMCNLNQIVDDVLLSFDFHLKEKGFVVNVKKEELELSKIDREAIETCIFNLVDNAIKYSAETKRIDIVTGQDQHNVFCSIKDYGIGISEQNQKKVYDKFYRVESALVHNTKGSGLGLNLVQGIIIDHKGRIEVKSKFGEGSTFSVYLPYGKLGV